MNWTIEYYRDSENKDPIKEFVDGLPEKVQAQVIGKIELLAKYGVLLKEPYTRHIRGKIWEMRIMVSKGYIRILYFSYTGRRFVLLNAFLKKTDKTPPAEIDIAEKRMQDFLNRQ